MEGASVRDARCVSVRSAFTGHRQHQSSREPSGGGNPVDSYSDGGRVSRIGFRPARSQLNCAIAWAPRRVYIRGVERRRLDGLLSAVRRDGPWGRINMYRSSKPYRTVLYRTVPYADVALTVLCCRYCIPYVRYCTAQCKAAVTLYCTYPTQRHMLESEQIANNCTVHTVQCCIR